MLENIILLMVCKILQYGLRRTGTNWLEQLLKTNFEICFDNFGSSFGHKHSMIISEFDNLNLLNKNINDDRNDRNDREYKFIVNVKHPYSWVLSMRKWRRKNNQSLESISTLIDRYNRFYSKWVEFSKQFPDRVIIVKYESLLQGYGRVMYDIQNKYKLVQSNPPSRNSTNMYREINRTIPQSGGFTQERKKWYIQKQYNKELPNNDKKEIKDLIDLDLINSLQYTLQ